jgi:hypothetical protein
VELNKIDSEDLFYKTQYRPKAFHINFHSQILYKYRSNKNNMNLPILIKGNSSGF